MFPRKHIKTIPWKTNVELVTLYLLFSFEFLVHKIVGIKIKVNTVTSHF